MTFGVFSNLLDLGEQLPLEQGLKLYCLKILLLNAAFSVSNFH